MCAVCGCLASGKPAPQEGTYLCIECGEAGEERKATVKKGDPMPDCPECGGEAHWKLA